MKSCGGCQKWRRWLQKRKNIVHGDWKEFVVHESSDSFLAAAEARCQLCRYIRVSLLNNVNDEDLRKSRNIASDQNEGFATVYINNTYSTESRRADGKTSDIRYSIEYIDGSESKFSATATFTIEPFSSALQACPTTDVSNLPQDMEFLRDRSKYCEEEHKRCGVLSSYVPTRLLYVGTKETPQLRLFLKKENPSKLHLRYVTLSHCWGGELPFGLQDRNLESLKSQIDEPSLPKSFQDAIYVAREFSIEYLWIDAMCIIQDSKADWQQESSLMCQTFQHSYFTIAAGYAINSSGGLFKRRFDVNPNIIVDVWQPTTGRVPFGRMQFILCDTTFYKHLVTNEPLHRRGWVVQEQFLSSRIVHFNSTQVFWECADHVACQNYPEGLPSAMLPDFRLGCYGRGTYNTEDLSLPSLRKWIDLIQLYSKCNLTYATDKLVAIQGLVAFFQQDQIECENLAGLWTDDLLGQLLWYHTGDRQQSLSSTYRAPSWSWASIDREIHYWYGDPQDVALAEIESYSKTLFVNGSCDPTTPVWIDLCGNLVDFGLHYGQDSDTESFEGYLLRWPSFQILETQIENYIEDKKLDQSQTFISYKRIIEHLTSFAVSIVIIFDCQEALNEYKRVSRESPNPLLFLPIRLGPYDGIKGLVVKQVKDNEFSRIGAAGLIAEGPSDGDERDIVNAIMTKFLLGEMKFQQDEVEIYGKKKIRLV